MLGPATGSRRKAKAKAKRSNTSDQDNDRSMKAGFDNAEGWDAIVTVLRDSFDLPDLTTRSGLKKVHSNFNKVYADMDKLYEGNMDNLKIRGAIVLIYAKMCVDTILRDKLFEKGILKRVMPLCHIDETRNLALRALSTITHHAGYFARVEIAKQANVLVILLRDHPGDETVAELVILILAHSVSAVANGDIFPANKPVLQQIYMTLLFTSVFETIKRPHSRPGMMIDHVLELLSFSAVHTSSPIKACPQSIGFLVAGFRSKDWVTRSLCFEILTRLYCLEAEDEVSRFEPEDLIKAVRRGIPPHLISVLGDYGMDRSEMMLTLTCMRDFQNAMGESLRDKDLHKLGLTLAKLIVQTEFGIVDGYFEAKDPATGGPIQIDTGLPFARWADSLPHCARAIRQAGKHEELDYADILDIKHHLVNRRNDDACSIAQTGIKRNPDQAYFYYALSLSDENVDGLRAAKQGLKCGQITPFIKHQMMWRAVRHAGDMGIEILHRLPEIGSKRWEEGIAYLNSAVEDAKAFYDSAPPDNRYMKNVGYWLVLLTMLTAESLSPDLRELKPILEKLKRADEFSTVFGVPTPKTDLRLAQQAAVQHYASGVKEFAGVFESLDKYKFSGPRPVNCYQVGDPLSAWLETIRQEDGTIESSPPSSEIQIPSKVDHNHLILYRCSWCSNPSAALRKCSGCGATRYCDARCQKAHWALHKSTCKK